MDRKCSNEYDNKARAARSEDERRQLRLEQELKEKQITWEFSQKTAKDSVSREFNLQKLKLEFEEKNRLAKSEKNRLEADRKRNDAIAAANLKTSRTYSYAAATVACLLAVIALITVFAYRQNRNDNLIIKKLVNEQEHTIEQRTKELAESNERLAHANKKLVELVQYNAHKMREPLTRVMGAMAMLEYTTADEFCKEITPEIQRAVSDLDNSIMQVITLADETIEQYGR
jgi:C4-dicarboxylate-specific signal transduction histidine kinase